MVARLVPAPECARSEGDACSAVAPEQACTGRLTPAAAAAAAARSWGIVQSELVERAQARGLVVHPYTFRNEV
jgi:glycerophosphoryl diester phosphodiesterase